MDKLNMKKIAWFLVKLFGLYWLSSMAAFGFGKGLYLLTSIDLYPIFSILKLIFFAIFCALALFWKPITLLLMELADRDLNESGPAGEAPAWQKTLFFLAAVLFFYLHLFHALLAAVNHYANRGNTFYTVNYDGVGPIGVLMLLAVSVPLAALAMLLLRKSRLVQSAAPILALICGALAVLALVLPSGSEEMMEEFVLSQISPVSLPDQDVLLWALPALVLTYYGRQSGSFQRQNRWAKLLAYGAIALSCTFAGDLLGLAGGFLLRG